MAESSEYLTAEQVSEKLQLHPRTVRRLLSTGELPGRQVGRKWIVSAAALQRFIETGGEKPPEQTPPVVSEEALERALRNGTKAGKKGGGSFK